MAEDIKIGTGELGSTTLGKTDDVKTVPQPELLSTGERLASRLPTYFPKDPASGNYLLLEPIAREIDHGDDDLSEIGAAMNVQTATTLDQLRRIGALVDLPPTQNETIEHYRARLLSRFQVTTSEATINDLLHAASVILNIRKEAIQYDEPESGSTENGTASLTIPGDAFDGAALSSTEIATILQGLVAAQYRLSTITSGTKKFVSIADYDAGTYDGTAIGFDGLDGNGDPLGTGGTFSGLIR
jgi:hypothetical protein